jgi:hypothetical protein
MTKKKQSTEAAVREIRRRTRRKFAPSCSQIHVLLLPALYTAQRAQRPRIPWLPLLCDGVVCRK